MHCGTIGGFFEAFEASFETFGPTMGSLERFGPFGVLFKLLQPQMR